MHFEVFWIAFQFNPWCANCWLHQNVKLFQIITASRSSTLNAYPDGIVISDQTQLWVSSSNSSGHFASLICYYFGCVGRSSSERCRNKEHGLLYVCSSFALRSLFVCSSFALRLLFVCSSCALCLLSVSSLCSLCCSFALRFRCGCSSLALCLLFACSSSACCLPRLLLLCA